MQEGNQLKNKNGMRSCEASVLQKIELTMSIEENDFKMAEEKPREYVVQKIIDHGET